MQQAHGTRAGLLVTVDAGAAPYLGLERLGRISKRGNRYVFTLLVHCARASVETLSNCEDRLGAWLRRQLENKQRSVVIVALAAHLARIKWALLHKGERFAPEPEATAAR